MSAGRIAVVITCRDLGGMLLEAVESIERQTRSAHEIVVVDDRSSDPETRQILARLIDGGTCVVQGPGRGASAARNLGAQMTSAEYLVGLDGDDTLEPGYFATAAARLDEESALDFVTCAMRAFGEASYVWAPSTPTFADAVSTGGVPHASTMVRRRLWDEVGGFDEDIPSFELLDFWASALDRGFRGIVLPEPFINYRIRRDSGYRRSIQQQTYLSRYRQFYAKHRSAIARHAIELLAGKEAFFISQRNYWRGLEERAAALESELANVEREIAETTAQLTARGLEPLHFEHQRPATTGAADTLPIDLALAPSAPGRPGRGVILAYHRVAELTPDAHALCTPPAVFRDHMRRVRELFTPIGLDDLVRAAAAGDLPPDAVAVTFDDGYLDALTTAAPILEEFGIPATFFVNSDRLIEPHERWWDILERIFLGDFALPPRLMIDVGGQWIDVPTATATERAEAAGLLNRTAWPLDETARARMADEVAAWCGHSCAPRDTHRVMTAAELRELAGRPGRTIGAHTTHHLALTTQPRETKRREIVDDRAAIARIIGRSVDLFSYPYGDCDAETLDVVREAGFRAAVTVETGLVSAGCNRLLLPRVEVTPGEHGTLPQRLIELFGQTVAHG